MSVEYLAQLKRPNPRYLFDTTVLVERWSEHPTTRLYVNRPLTLLTALGHHGARASPDQIASNISGRSPDPSLLGWRNTQAIYQAPSKNPNSGPTLDKLKARVRRIEEHP